jgi:8-oxo-dGTP pyrophosphatase MutT (NUDIX family)
VDLEERVLTAGAYVAVGDLVPFMVGPTRAGDRLGIVRLGGHRDVGEASWLCACREVLEEASARIQPIQPPETYWSMVTDDIDGPLETRTWEREDGRRPDIRPLLVRERVGTDGDLSVMYLARTDDTPRPATEAHGLLLLSRTDVARLSRQTLTLRQYLRAGGQAQLRDKMPLDLPLQPFAQLRWLAIMWELHPDLFDA